MADREEKAGKWAKGREKERERFRSDCAAMFLRPNPNDNVQLQTGHLVALVWPARAFKESPTSSLWSSEWPAIRTRSLCSRFERAPFERRPRRIETPSVQEDPRRALASLSSLLSLAADTQSAARIVRPAGGLAWPCHVCAARLNAPLSTGTT